MDEEAMQDAIRTTFAAYRGRGIPCYKDDIYGPNPLDDEHILIGASEIGGKVKFRAIFSKKVDQLAAELLERGVTALEYDQLMAAMPQLSAFWDKAKQEGAIA